MRRIILVQNVSQDQWKGPFLVFCPYTIFRSVGFLSPAIMHCALTKKKTLHKGSLLSRKKKSYFGSSKKPRFFCNFLHFRENISRGTCVTASILKVFFLLGSGVKIRLYNIFCTITYYLFGQIRFKNTNALRRAMYRPPYNLLYKD